MAMDRLPLRRRSSDALSTPWTLSRSTSSTTLEALTTKSVSTAVGSSRESTTTSKDKKADHGGIITTTVTEVPEEFAELNQRRAEMAAVASRIWALYNAGTPLFTRDALLAVARQLDQHPAIRTGERNIVVNVCAMDGKRVRLATQAGTFSASPVHPNIVLVNAKPQIDYWTIEKLTGSAVWHVRRFNPAHAFLPVRIGHSQEARYRDANGKIATTGSSTVAELASGLAHSSQSSTPAPASATPRPRLDVDEVRSIFQRHRVEWEASDACQQLRETLFATLAPQVAPRGRAVIRKVVAFACSSMTDEREGGIARHAVQHAMILTVRDVLEQLQRLGANNSEQEDETSEDYEPKAMPTIECFAQDPAYVAADLDVLAEEGITVLDDPHGFLAVDATSVVISIAPSVPVRQIVADIARPAAMIWGRIVDARFSPLVEDMGGWSDPASPRVKAMVQDGEYAEFDFPKDPQNFGTVDGVAIYVRTSAPPPSLEDDQPGWGTGFLQRLQRTLLCQPSP